MRLHNPYDEEWRRGQKQAALAGVPKPLLDVLEAARPLVEIEGIALAAVPTATQPVRAGVMVASLNLVDSDKYDDDQYSHAMMRRTDVIASIIPQIVALAATRTTMSPQALLTLTGVLNDQIQTHCEHHKLPFRVRVEITPAPAVPNIEGENGGGA